MPPQNSLQPRYRQNPDEKYNKWISGKNRNIEELIKKYNVKPNNNNLFHSSTQASASWKPRRKEEKKPKLSHEDEDERKVKEWEDKRFIKEYTDYSAMMILIENITRKHSKICESYSLGTSEEGRRIECIHIAGDVKHQRPLLRPMVKYVANIHGDEVVGRELLLGLARSVYKFQPCK